MPQTLSQAATAGAHRLHVQQQDQDPVRTQEPLLLVLGNLKSCMQLGVQLWLV